MSKLPPPPSSPPPELAELAALRLDRDWTWKELAAAMRRAGFPISLYTLRYSLKVNRQARPIDRTLHKIRRFLQADRANARRRSDRRPGGGQSDAARAI